MTSFPAWIESTWLSTTLRDSPNIFLYPTILAFHTLGLAFFVGISSAIALRILGVAPAVPLAPLRTFYPIMWLGFLFNAVSGVLLLVIEPTKFLTMLDFYVKLVAIAAAVYCNRLLYVRRFRHPAAVDPDPMPTTDKVLAVAILILWGVSITAGRLTAYDDATTQWQTAVGTLGVTIACLVVGYIAFRLYSSDPSNRSRVMEQFLRYWMRWPGVEHLIYKYLWLWGVCQSLHFVGMALLIGTVGMLDLRMLGMAKQVPPVALQRLIPWGVFGFVLCLGTGLLFVTGMYANINVHPYVVLKSDVFLQLKLLFVVLAGVNLLAFYVTGMAKAVDRLAPGEDAPTLAKVFAGASLCFWIAVMYFARLIPSGKFQP